MLPVKTILWLGMDVTDQFTTENLEKELGHILITPPNWSDLNDVKSKLTSCASNLEYQIYCLYDAMHRYDADNREKIEKLESKKCLIDDAIFLINDGQLSY